MDIGNTQVNGGYSFQKFVSLKQGVNIGDDCSINVPGSCHETAELRTKPLPPKDAMILLEKLFDIINRYGKTNSSCGLHVNISSVNKSDMKKFNPLPFLSSKLWNQILKKFNRHRNNYCRPLINGKPKSNVDAFSQLGFAVDEKHHCVNLVNFQNGINKSSRVEVRGFGNKDYTKKYQPVSNYVKRIEKLFRLSCKQPFMFRSISV